MDSTSHSNVPDLDDTSERQAALRRYHVLDTAPEEEFDRITSLVAKVCDVPTALITLIDDERQWFKSCFGFNSRETDIGVSFCVHAVDEGRMMVVEDATSDPRFKDNPIVTGPPHVRFYAGAPLTTPEGIDIGTLCIIDYEPRTFDAAQREILTRLADTVVDQFERRSAETQVQQLVEENPQPMYVYATEGGAILTANAAAREQYGYDNSTFRSLTVDDLEAPPTVQPAVKTRALHERRDGSRFAVRLRERDVLFDGYEARLAVPQLLSDETDDVSEIVFQARPNGTLQSLSADWERATGLPVQDAIGQRLPDLIVSDDRAAALEVLTPLADGTQESCRHEARFHTADGERRLALRARVTRNANGAPIGVIGTLTPLGPTQPTSTDSATAAEETDTPDAADASSATDEPDEPDYSVFSTRLPSFDAPDTESPPDPASPSPDAPTDTETTSPDPPSSPSGDSTPTTTPSESEPSSAPFDLTQHLHALLDQKAEAFDHPAVTLHRSLPDAEVPISLDADAVTDLVDALLDNALTHTEEGTVTLRLTADETAAEVEIVDTGTGAEERFMQVYTTTTSGPSLQRIHEKATRMGLSLNMEEADTGTRFRLTLPHASAPNDTDPFPDEPLAGGLM